MAEAAASARESDLVWPLSATGFRDTARLAGSNPRMMRDIALTNRPAILQRLRAYQDRLAQIVDLVESGSDMELEAWLAARQREHDAYRHEKRRPSVHDNSQQRPGDEAGANS
jgi:prephenate dehydrogenase